MELSTLENWLWDAACSIRGPLDAPKYKDYILPLLFYKRLSDVYEDELTKLSQEFGDEALARELANEDRSLIRFYIPNGYTWPQVRRNPTRLGERLTEAMREIAKENPKLKGVIDIVDFNATAAGQRILDDDNLARLMEILNRHRLGLRDVEPDILGRAYEYLLRKFAEGSGQSAGEFYTPKEVAILMAHILD
ncbi:MAG: SAM-dependent DNA methyltransferase, partial [Chloroflexi bacterium]